MPKENQKLVIYSPQGSKMPPEKNSRLHTRKKLTAGERLLRNSAIACAFLLGILSMKNINHPIAQNTAEAVEKAIILDFNVDDALGELHFVKHFLPESALVFWNLSDPDRLKRPTDGTILHEFSELQPWYTFYADQSEPVYAMKTGILQAANQSPAGDWILEFSHHDGTSAVYAYVTRGNLQIGDSVTAGEQITEAAQQGAVYVEYRSNGKSICAEEFY